jgi:hypothetical protein
VETRGLRGSDSEEQAQVNEQRGGQLPPAGFLFSAAPVPVEAFAIFPVRAYASVPVSAVPA